MHEPVPSHPEHAHQADREGEVELGVSTHCRTLDLEQLLEPHPELRNETNCIPDPVSLLIPPEVASTIFQNAIVPWSVLWDDSAYIKEFQAAVKTRLLLGAVCRGWRQIAWSSPRLWTSIAVPLDSLSCSLADLVLQWLERSGGLPLDIFVYKHRWNCRLKFPHEEALIEVLSKYSDRWQTLKVEITSNGILSSVCGRSSSAPMLRFLSLKCGVLNIFFMQNDLPRPEEVVSLRIPYSDIKIAWDNVTIVRALGLQVSQSFELLCLAPKLQKLFIAYAFYSYPPFPVKKIVHYRLEELNIRKVESSEIKILLEGIVLPGLASLTVLNRSDSMFTTEPLRYLSNSLSPSTCQLRQLTIMHTEYGGSDIVNILERIPSLEHLTLFVHLDSYYLPDKLLEHIANTSIVSDSDSTGTSAFLPRLRSFTYNAGKKYCDLLFPWDLVPPLFGNLSALDDSRRRPLQSVHIMFDRSDEDPVLAIDEAILPSFLSVLKAGLKLDIHYFREELDLMKPVHDLWAAEAEGQQDYEQFLRSRGAIVQCACRYDRECTICV